MAHKRISSLYFMADSKDDLTHLLESQMGTTCFVIEDACEYKRTSDGRWIPQTASSIATTPGAGKNYTNNLNDALSYDDLQKYFNYAPNWAKVINIAWHPSESVLEKRQAIDLHMGDDGISFHFIKDITFDETTGQPKFNLKKVWIANPNYVAE